MKKLILGLSISLSMVALQAGARVVVDTGASDPYFKVNGKRVASEFEATRVGMVDQDALIEKCSPQKGALETADGRPAGAAYKCSEMQLHITTKGKPSWKKK